MPSQVVSSGRRKYLGHFDEGEHCQRECTSVKGRFNIFFKVNFASFLECVLAASVLKKLNQKRKIECFLVLKFQN